MAWHDSHVLWPADASQPISFVDLRLSLPATVGRASGSSTPSTLFTNWVFQFVTESWSDYVKRSTRICTSFILTWLGCIQQHIVNHTLLISSVNIYLVWDMSGSEGRDWLRFWFYVSKLAVVQVMWMLVFPFPALTCGPSLSDCWGSQIWSLWWLSNQTVSGGLWPHSCLGRMFSWLCSQTCQLWSTMKSMAYMWIIIE